jgi:hypothetical protein
MYSAQGQQMMFDDQGYDVEEVDQQFQQDDSALLQVRDLVSAPTWWSALVGC